MNSDSSIVLPILPRSGLGNMMFVWAEAYVFSQLNSMPMVQPYWHPIRFGPLLRGENRKRFYGNLFIPQDTLKRLNIEISVKLNLANVHYNVPVMEIDRSFYQDASASKNRNIFIFNKVPFWKSCFKNLQKYDVLINEELKRITYPSLLREVQNRGKPKIGIHIRLGDYKELSSYSEVDFSARRHTRNPIFWYIRVLESLRDELGYAVKATVFSDGTKDELLPILKLENVEFAENYSALSDLLTLASSSIMISTCNSTFSGWALFLGQSPTIHYPQRASLYEPILLPKTRERIFEGGYDPETMEIPKLLKENLLERLALRS